MTARTNFERATRVSKAVTAAVDMTLADFIAGRDPAEARKSNPGLFYILCCKAGMTRPQTAKMAGVSKQAAGEAAERYGLVFRPNHQTDHDDVVRQMHEKKWSQYEIAEHTGLSIHKVRRIARRLDLRWQVKKGGPFALLLVSELTPTELDQFESLRQNYRYSRIAAFRGVGRHDLAARLEAKA